eukprot:CAMPEP_0179015552 /NCGR_PEP_ID=MMETSP0796-20121207/2855_1 /TAXON_ID=73915 /ORGANISM="Pyrodinium bahamense, Strain pbaha01" /LENGTH=491 /DNA_ID=CAMNT_0020711199 /DNA_START=55 /DNA_END=1530 /DNA_ORIENTATION=+
MPSSGQRGLCHNGGVLTAAAATSTAMAAVMLRPSASGLFVSGRGGHQVHFLAGTAHLLRPKSIARDLLEGGVPAAARPAPSASVYSSATAMGALAGCVAASAAQRVRPAAWRRGRAATSRLAGGLADCPYTEYGTKDIDVSHERNTLEEVVCPLEVQMPEQLGGDLEGQRKYFAKNLPQIYKDLKKHGAVVFRGFELSKDSDGFQKVGDALQLERCEDPLHSVAARDAVDKSAGVYEAVNKPSRRKFYVGMHNEMVGNRAPGAAIFVCFKAAEEGGEFLVADGRKMFRQLNESWLASVYDREVKYSTAEFPVGFVEQLPDFLQGVVEPLAYGAVQQALRMKVDFDTELVWERSEYDGSKILQVRAMPQVPIVRHPYTGEPAWWGSMHSHAEFLRREREKVFGDEGFAETTGSSRINKTDVYYADTGEKIPNEELKHLNQVTMELAIPIKMQAGDMVLLDNYLVMHGRCPFEGTRKHAVTWFKSPDYAKAAA